MKRALLMVAALTLIPGSRGVVAAQTPIAIAVATTPTGSATPILYALQAGLFRKYGLNVDFQQMNNGALIVAALLGGSLQIGSANTFSLVTAFAHGTPIRIVAPSGISVGDNAFNVLVVKNDSPIRTAADLTGKIIGSPIAKGDLATTSVIAWIDQHGGDSQSVHIVEIPPAATLAALDEGRIDAAAFTSPNSTIALESGKVRVIGKTFAAVGSRFAISDWIASTDWAAKNPDAVQRFARALREASAYTNAHRAETLPLMAAFMHVEPHVLEHSVLLDAAEYVEPRDIQPVIDVAVRYKVIDRPFDALELISPSALRPRQ